MPSTPISSIAWCKPAGSPLALEYGAMSFPADSFPVWEARFASAFAAMKALEAGAVANPDEGRMVGHYWLRAPELAPKAELAQAIRDDVNGVRAFAAKVHSGEIAPPSGGRFRHLLVIGIGGSALGPQLVADALAPKEGNKLEPHFLDNTDPEGIARVLHRLGKELAATLAIVISKSGGTPETRNGMLLAAEAYEQAGLAFAKHAVAVTGSGSQLDKHAKTDGFLARFPMYDWVGGRTSVMSCVGLLPAALQGIDIDAFLRGAAEMDAITRKESLRDNPAALLAMLWHHATNGRGERDMVILPYCDRLLLFSRYLQQLVMESLGKELDLAGKVVHQGIAVYGNKGSTDQHAYVQQLREGVNNFFAVFVEVLRKGGSATEVEPGATAGDFLNGFLLGTRKALRDNGRPSLTISVETIEERTLGALIALFERAVGFYATLVNINAYHQPGVEAGKKAAAAVLALQERLLRAMKAAPGVAKSAAQWVGEGDAESAFFTLRHLAYSGRPVRMEGDGPDATFSWQGNA